MADYSHHHTYRVARAPHGASGRRFGWVLAVVAILMLAALGWVWTQQRSIDSPLPQTATTVSTPAAAPAPATAKTVMTPTVATPKRPSAVKPESAPPSDVVAASGDTRTVD